MESSFVAYQIVDTQFTVEAIICILIWAALYETILRPNFKYIPASTVFL